MSQNGQTHFKNLAEYDARFLKCVWPFWDIMYEMINVTIQLAIHFYYYSLYTIGTLFNHLIEVRS